MKRTVVAAQIHRAGAPRLVSVNERSCRVGLRTPIPLQSA